MSPELMSIYGIPCLYKLTGAQQKKLSFTELFNFFSLVLKGEWPLVRGMAHRLYLKQTGQDVTDYLHHFIDEESKHMIVFEMFLNRCFGKYNLTHVQRREFGRWL